jgi:hypothetical protein
MEFRQTLAKYRAKVMEFGLNSLENSDQNA